MGSKSSKKKNRDANNNAVNTINDNYNKQVLPPPKSGIVRSTRAKYFRPKTQDNEIRIGLFGSIAVGKTTLIVQLIEKHFISE